jgi:hypothetical protein
MVDEEANSIDLAAILRVGGGRGFVVAGEMDRFVVTAAMPP